MELREELLAIEDLRTKEIEVPQWNRKITIREMNLHVSMRAYNPSRVKFDEESGPSISMSSEDIAYIVAACVIEPKSGKRVFLDSDIPKLEQKHREAMMYIYNQITALSGSVEEQEKK